jgi:hypothetical protein
MDVRLVAVNGGARAELVQQLPETHVLLGGLVDERIDSKVDLINASGTHRDIRTGIVGFDAKMGNG